ncbi:hypothetical protein KJ564_07605 [bacterium]|nr:hypothetical protein [bacterium]MBU1882449.1 hypothetical protein [bacterium]
MYLFGLSTYFRLKRNLRRPLEELKREQWESFKALVYYAYYNVPFYRKLYDQVGFHPQELKSRDDIQKVPLIRKALFQDTELQDCLALGHDADKLRKKKTSGSSGSPLEIFVTPDDRIYRTLIHLRILFHNGMTLRDQMAHISDDRHVPDFRYTFQNLGFLPKEFVYAADSPEDQLANLKKIDPAVIYSYSSSMVLLADEIKKLGSCPVSPRLVFTTGELLNSADRDLINEQFGVQLRDIYGCVEMGDIAWQCSEVAGYHVSIDSFLFEAAQDGQPVESGEEGRLVITNLHSKAMPFIRYEVGDVVTAPEEDLCSCGCTFPRMKMLQGRADDWLYRPDRTKVSPLIFVVASIRGVRQYRMIQKAFDHLIVEILPGKYFDEATLPEVSKHVTEVMGDGVKIETKAVETIPQQAGKMRRVISEIPKDNKL